MLIFDWDVHHGDGTQSIFFPSPSVLTVSIHRRTGGFYPVGTGYPSEVGEGAGAGFNVNVGWQAKGMGDGDYLVGRGWDLDSPYILYLDLDSLWIYWIPFGLPLGLPCL